MNNETSNSANHGELLKILSIKSKKSRTQIAEGLGVGPAHVSRLYNTTVLPNKIIRNACKFFGVTIDFFASPTSYISASAVDPGKVEESMTVYGPSNELKIIMEQLNELNATLAADRERFNIERNRLLAIIEKLAGISDVEKKPVKHGIN